ncbi:MAG: capsule assembly Wzi family protein [Terriglobales bacterium]
MPPHRSAGSVYVPLDSWVYPALGRLAALGYVRSNILGMRPWTRLECARLLAEAEDRITEADDREAAQLYKALAEEFARDSGMLNGDRPLGLQVESVRVGMTNISGPPLTDGYHFGQTVINDFGRPYREGTNVIAGLSVRAEAGPLAVYFSGEYQHAPSAPALANQVVTAMAAADYSSPLYGRVIPAVNRLRWQDSYVALAIKGWQASFGKQSLWWGPGEGGPLLFSDNAEPITMLRLSRTHPVKIPLLGAVRTEFFIGQLSGQDWMRPDFHTLVASYGRQPYIHGQKVSFKPTPNLEFSVSRTAMFGGAGLPVTPHTFWRSFASYGNETGPRDPGDRRSACDLTYRVPYLRDWLTVYVDAFTEDEFSPIGYPRRSAISPGFYMPRIPGLRKLDLRAEGVYTDLPGLRGTGYFYWNGKYVNGYTNEGNILGSWVGRQGRGAQAWATYWLSGRNTIRVGYRHQGVNRDFLQGGHLDDISVKGDLWLRPDLSVSGKVQYESWRFPLLAPDRQTNVTARFQVTYWPKWSIH